MPLRCSVLALAVLCGAVLLVPGGSRAQTCGDADANGTVTVTDGVNVLRAAAGLPSPCAVPRCDVDGNGSVTVTDGVGTLRKAASLPSVCDAPVGTSTPTVAPSPGPALAFVEVEPAALGAAADVVVATDGDVVYAGGTAPGAPSIGVVASYLRSPATGALTFADVPPASGCTAPVLALSASADGRHLYGAHASCLELLVPAGAAGEIAGTLTPMNGGGVFGTAGARALAKLLVATPEGRHVYAVKSAAGSLATAIQCYVRDEEEGPLFFVHDFDHQDMLPGASGLVPRARADLAVSPDGTSLYVLARRGPFDATTAQQDIVEAWRRSIASGDIFFAGDAENGVDGAGYGDARALVVSPDGAHVYVGAVLDGTITLFARNPATSALAFVESRSDLTSGPVVDLAVSADGARVYAAVGAPSADRVVALDRNAVTGALAVAGEVRDGVDGASGLADVRALAVSPDGCNVYAATASGALVVLAAD